MIDRAQDARNRPPRADCENADFWLRMSLRKTRLKTAVVSERPRWPRADEYRTVNSASASVKLEPSVVAILTNDSSHPPATAKIEQRV